MHKKRITTAPPLAIFDLDGTLLDGDSEIFWSEFLNQQGLVDNQFLQKMKNYYLEYEQGRLDIHAYQSHLLGPLVEQPPKLLYKLRNEYLRDILKAFRPAMIQQVKELRGKGFTLLLLTATNDFLAVPIARALNFHHLICTRIRMNGSQFTNLIDGIPAFREGKLQLMEKWLHQQKRTLQGSWGFSDSHNDLPILEKVDFPVVVNPDAKLRQAAVQHHWPIMMI